MQVFLTIYGFSLYSKSMADSEPRPARGKMPSFEGKSFPPMKFPERPAWAPRPSLEELMARGKSPVIHETKDGPVINAAGEKERQTMAQELKAVWDLIPDGRRKELEGLVNGLFNAGAEEKPDPVKTIRDIVEPTDREGALRLYVSMESMRQAKEKGEGRWTLQEQDEIGRELLSELQPQVFPIVSRRAS